MTPGVPGLLEEFKTAELASGRRVLVLDNISRRPFSNPESFCHVQVEGELELTVTSEGVIASARVKGVAPKDSADMIPETLKSVMNSAYRERITGANDYVPGQRVTLYSYHGFSGRGWSFHCIL